MRMNFLVRQYEMSKKAMSIPEHDLIIKWERFWCTQGNKSLSGAEKKLKIALKDKKWDVDGLTIIQ